MLVKATQNNTFSPSDTVQNLGFSSISGCARAVLWQSLCHLRLKVIERRVKILQKPRLRRKGEPAFHHGLLNSSASTGKCMSANDHSTQAAELYSTNSAAVPNC